MKILLNGTNGYFRIKVAGYPLDSRSAILQCAHFRPDPEISGSQESASDLQTGVGQRRWVLSDLTPA